MYLRKINRRKDGKDHIYWALVESYRSVKGPRQRVIAYLGEMDASGRLGIQQAAEGTSGHQRDFFTDFEPEWVEIDIKRVRTEHVRDFGDIWLAFQLIKRLRLDKFFRKDIPKKREKIAWSDLAIILIIARFCDPRSELYISEHFYAHTALENLIGISQRDMYDNRLYRALDKLLPHKEALEMHLKERFGEMFDIKYNLLLYDVTSTYFEGEAKRNSQAKHGYSRDHRPDCKQVCIALVVTKEGIPLGYELFDGNTKDQTTVKEIILKMENQYGTADRIWVMDRGMISTKNIEFLKTNGRKYIIGTPKSQLKHFEKELLSEQWQQITAGLEVQYCLSPHEEDEVFILCRSQGRKEKEQAIINRFINNIEEGLARMRSTCEKGRLKDPRVAERRIGRLLQRNVKAAGLFDIQVFSNNGKLTLTWTRKKERQDWTKLTEGCYLLRSNVKEWTAEELWQAYIHLTDAEEAFRIQKSDLKVRPVWHQRKDRVQAHIFVCFLAFVLWKCFAQMCKQSGLGNEPRKIIHEISRIKLTDVILPTRKGVELRLQCVSKPDAHQKILLQHLGLKLPSRLSKNGKM